MKEYRHSAVKWVLALCLVLVLGFSVTAVAQDAANNKSTQIPTQIEAENVIKNYIDALERKDVDGSMKYCVDSRGSVEDQRELYKRLFAEGAPYPVSAKFSTIDNKTVKKVGTIGVANATVTLSDGTSESMHLKFIKDKGEWKIYVTSDK
jgi:hypothetical protein